MSGFQDNLPLARPSLPSLGEMRPLFERIWSSGIVTVGPLTRQFEEAAAHELGVEHAVMVNHGMTALMLSVRALGLTGEVVIPSFSWTATAGALAWNGIEPVFADIEPGRLTLDAAAAEAAITPRTTAIMPVNVFGVPPEIEALEDLGRRYGLPIIYDSAQGLGSRYGGRRCGGFGVVECFSLSPTKVVTALEGGLITTDNSALAESVRSMRDSGKNDEGLDIVRLGLSGRPSEVHAAIALKTLERLEFYMAQRLERMEWYRQLLEDLPGLGFQQIPQGSLSTGSYFVVLIDLDEAPVTRHDLRQALTANNIESKMYFHPPIHLQKVYAHLRLRYEGRLPVTEKAAAEGLALPLFGTMTRGDVERVAAVIRAMFEAAVRRRRERVG